MVHLKHATHGLHQLLSSLSIPLIASGCTQPVQPHSSVHTIGVFAPLHEQRLVL